MDDSEVQPPEIHEEEVFEIIDFTNASDWEKFIAQIDETIIDWQLNRFINLAPLGKGELTTGEWEVKTAELSFSKVQFTLTLHQLKQKENEHFEEFSNDDDEFELPLYGRDAMDMCNDFPARAHCLARWYGLRSFLIIKPDVDPIKSLSKINLLLSSIAVSLSNTLCSIPMFVHIQEFWRRMYAGQATSPGMQTQYDMVHLKRCPVQHAHLSGLLHLLKEKIGLTSLSSSSCKVATRFTYILSDWGSGGYWPTKLPNPDTLAHNFKALQAGCLEDPVGELHLSTTWPYRTGDMVIDNDMHSDYDPLKAPLWSIRLLYIDDITCLLSYYLYEYLKSTERKETLSDLLQFQQKEEQKEIGQALSRLTDAQPNTVIPIIPSKLATGISKVVSNPQNFLKRGAYAVSRNLMGEERIKAQDLNDVMKFIFGESEHVTDEPKSSDTTVLHYKLRAAPIYSLTHRIAISTMVVNLCHGGIWSVAKLWHSVVTELRRRLDSAQNLPAMETTNPDLRTCLLHQKLQMLNCCIFRKHTRENKQDETSSGEKAAADVQIIVREQETEKKTEQLHHFDGKAESSDLVEKSICIDEDDDISKNEEQTVVGEKKEEKPDVPRIDSVQSESDDDEFFECESVEDGMEQNEIESEVQTINENKEQPNIKIEEDKEKIEKSGDNLKPETPAAKMDEALVSSSAKTKEATPKYEPAGRLEQCGELRLLYEDCPLYVPVTQEHAPQTEDTLEELAEVYSKLGDTLEGSQVRAKMQSTSLLSDMMAFKAANPGCVLEDFVRWYSPRDFEEGCLSPRMRIPGNLWTVTWTSAQPVPAHRQKRIFDDTKEAEKVLHFLTNLKPAEILQLLLPVCIQEMIIMLKRSSSNLSSCLPSLPLICNGIESKASQTFKSWKMSTSVANQFVPWSKEDRSKVDDILRQINFAENLVERAKSLQHKFSGLGDKDIVDTFVKSLLEHPEQELDGGSNGRPGKLVREYFFSQQASKFESIEAPAETQKMPTLPKPAGREFIIRTLANNPSPYSHEVPHRLYAVLMQSEFRLACSISTDTTFF